MEPGPSVGPYSWLLIAIALFLVASFIGWWRERPVRDGAPGEPYRVFRRDFDLELSAREAIASLDEASPDSLKGWLQSDDSAWKGWIARTEALLAEAEANAEESADSIRSAAQAIDPTGLYVAILIDQSGSMKGEPIAQAAATSALLAQLLSRLGAKSEILGFSTAGWHGGEAYLQWKESGRPRRPGRLCALRHVIYKTADEDVLSDEARAAIVHPDLLRENVDGEALDWAAARLSVRSEPHKLLIVISDGAPVDDATLKHNGPQYLYRHLMRAIDEVRNGSILLGAIGIGHRVSSWYPMSEEVQKPEDLQAASIGLLKTMIAQVAAR